MDPTQGPAIYPPDMWVLVALYYLGGQEPYFRIATLFGIAPSTAFKMVRTVCRGIAENQRFFVQWPNAAKCAENEAVFRARNGFPGVIGVIDGTHIPISAPQESPNAYINYKKFFSIVLQAIVDSSGKFIDISCGWPGSSNDRGVFNNSPIFREVTDRREDFLPEERYHLLGDGAYPLLEWLMIPYRRLDLVNPHLPDKQNYNSRLSSTRVAVEHVFGYLKGRFRRFQDCAHLLDVRWAPVYVVAACCLHNLCIDDGDGLEFYVFDPYANDPGPILPPGPANPIGDEKRLNIALNLP